MLFVNQRGEHSSFVAHRPHRQAPVALQVRVGKPLPFHEDLSHSVPAKARAKTERQKDLLPCFFSCVETDWTQNAVSCQQAKGTEDCGIIEMLLALLHKSESTPGSVFCFELLVLFRPFMRSPSSLSALRAR